MKSKWRNGSKWHFKPRGEEELFLGEYREMHGDMS